MQQVDRYRERLLEKLDETASIGEAASSKAASFKSMKTSSKLLKTSTSSSSRRHHSGTSSSSNRRHDEGSRSSKHKRSKSPGNRDRSASPVTSKRPREDISDIKEEGEASDDDGGSSHNSHKRSKHRDDEVGDPRGIHYFVLLSAVQ